MSTTLDSVRRFDADQLITLCYMLMEQATCAPLDSTEELEAIFFRFVLLFVAAAKLLQRGLRIRRSITQIVGGWSTAARALWREVKEEISDAAAKQLCTDLVALPWDKDTIVRDAHDLFLKVDLVVDVIGGPQSTPGQTPVKQEESNKHEEKKNSELGLNFFLDMLIALCLIPRGDAKSACFGKVDEKGDQVRSFKVVNQAALEVWKRLIACINAKDFESTGLDAMSYKMPGTKEVFNMLRDHYITKIFRDNKKKQLNNEPKVGDVVIDHLPTPDDAGGRDVLEWLSIVVVFAMMTGPYRLVSVSTLPLLWFATLVFDSLLDLESQLSQQNTKMFLEKRYAASAHVVRMFAVPRKENPASFSAGPAFSEATPDTVRLLDLEESKDFDYKANPKDDTSTPGVAHCFSCGVPTNVHEVDGKDRKFAIKNCGFKRVLRYWAFVGGSEDEPPKVVKKK